MHTALRGIEESSPPPLPPTATRPRRKVRSTSSLSTLPRVRFARNRHQSNVAKLPSRFGFVMEENSTEFAISLGSRHLRHRFALAFPSNESKQVHRHRFHLLLHAPAARFARQARFLPCPVTAPPTTTTPSGVAKPASLYDCLFLVWGGPSCRAGTYKAHPKAKNMLGRDV